MKKKVISLLLVLALGFSLFSAALAVGNEPTFSDVPASHWAFTFIEELVERKAINGYPDGKFYPDKTVSREEFAKIMVVAAGLTAAPAAESSYADVPLTYWASAYIETARPYMTAYQNQGQLFFYPTAGALREDIAVAVVKLKGLDASMADLSILSTMFSDVGSISEVARPYVALAVEQGIINGYTDGTFRGQGTITRSEAAAMLWRAFQQGSGDKVIPDDILPSATPSQSPTPAPTPTPSAAPTPTPTPTPEPTPTPTPTPEPTPQADNYSLVVSKNFTTGNVGVDIDGAKAEVLLSDGSKTVLALNNDSYDYVANKKITSSNGFNVGDIVTYSFGKNGYASLEVRAKLQNAGAVVYRDGAKVIRVGGKNYNAATDCVVYMDVDSGSSTNFKAYSLQSLKSFDANAKYTVALENGEVVALYLEDQGGRPSGAASEIIYGIVSAYNGEVKVDGVAYRYVTVQSGSETYKAYIDKSVSPAVVGDIVEMDITSDDIYNSNDFAVINNYSWISNSRNHAVAGYVKSYNEKDGTVTVGKSYESNGDGTFKVSGEALNTFAITRDTVIYYVDRDSNVAMESANLSAMDAITAKMNIIVIVDEDARNGDEAAVIIFEISNEADIVTDIEKF